MSPGIAGSDRYRGTATLEYWANPLTCLGSFRVSLTVSVAEGSWRGIAIPDGARSERAREGLDFLLLIDPVFTLRLPDGSTRLVSAVAEGERLALGAVEG
ncbi:hypothetical protein F4556_006002 [Kitasatospora gansuensis]|uniref:Uncharacterized protein n=1 Tax=Kitasatospora gansuensis TaxID=258050 RepID=A0A7W7SI27_9ACTN|nr:hypothetical protein [Kitasatospora gansuensis]MBB4950467.1 hypothetical protein [Kitasatospora gansuensis]